MHSNVDAMVVDGNNWREIDRELRSIASGNAHSMPKKRPCCAWSRGNRSGDSSAARRCWSTSR